MMSRLYRLWPGYKLTRGNDAFLGIHRLSARGVTTSAFELFKVGVGPSSSHTVGPMKACNAFASELGENLHRTAKLNVELYGSLSLTGKGHKTDQACMLGLSGVSPESVGNAQAILEDIVKEKRIKLGGLSHAVPFHEETDIVWRYDRLPQHSNAMTVSALDENGSEIHKNTYFSIGGGFIRTLEEIRLDEEAKGVKKAKNESEWHFGTMKELQRICREKQLLPKDVMRENEKDKGLSDEEIDAKLDHIWATMKACVERGLTSEEEHLEGSLMVKRRAPKLNVKEREFHRSSTMRTFQQPQMPMVSSIAKLSMYAIAVNEENAGGWSQIVTAPTNGASGVIPACIYHLMVDLLTEKLVTTGFKHIYGTYENALVQAPRDFLMTAAAIGVLIKQNASISGAEAGCMGEVGSASSMAAAGIASVLGGTSEHIENAAEIAMEHSLGLTCDPVDGLVQVPCIERNAMGATKALNAATLALMATSSPAVSFDMVIEVMKKIGEDMKEEYKETALGGLAGAFKHRRSAPVC